VSSNDAIIAAFAAYLIAVIGIGAVAYRRTRDLADYILGGRRLGRWVTAFSAVASDMSGWLLLGLPGYAYLAGMESLWIALGLLLGTYANWRLIAARLRCYSELANNALTLPDFFEHRFADSSHLLRLLSATFILLFFTFYTASGLVAGGKLFAAVFGLHYEWAVLTGTLVVVAYTFLGGFLAVSWTDLVQGLLMLAALIIVPVVALEQLGVSASWRAIHDLDPHLLQPLTGRDGEALGGVALLSLLGWGLGYFGQPHILARFKAIRDPEQLAAARRIAVSWVALTLTGALAVGLVGIAYLSPPLGEADSEKVFIELVSLLFHPLIAGVLLAAILAAIMSTADSQLLVASAALTEDFYKALWRPNARQLQLVWLNRAAVVLVAAIAVALAWSPENKVLDLVAYAWAGFGAAFGPVLVLALYWPRMTRNGALAGILGGGISVIVWKQLEGGLFDLYEIIPGVLCAALATLLVSALDRPPPESVTALHREFANRVKTMA